MCNRFKFSAILVILQVYKSLRANETILHLVDTLVDRLQRKKLILKFLIMRIEEIFFKFSFFHFFLKCLSYFSIFAMFISQ